MTYSFVKQVEIQAPAKQVWEVLIDLKNWHQWTSTIIDISPLDGDKFTVGARYRVRQPKLAPATWKIETIKEGESFSWIQTQPGLTLIANHTISQKSEHVSEICLEFSFDGFLGYLASKTSKNLIEQYLEIEAHGLKARCEGK